MAEGKIRIKDIAKIAGVSATTVSNVIHGRTEKVSRKTRKRIEEILDEQEYAPSMGARILSGKSSGMIAVVVGKRQEWEQESEKLEEILREIEKSLDEREYYMLLHFVKTAEEFVRYAAVWKLDGTEEYGKAVWQGMQKIFSKKGCCLEEEQYLEIPKDRDLRRMFYKIRLAGLALSADMLVFASAVQGAEAVGYLHDLEIKVPEEIEVIAVGKEETALICRPQLTTVEFDKKRLVRQAIEELYVQIIKGYILTKSGKISVKTIIRGSCN